MLKDPAQMALSIGVIVALCLLLLILVGPKLTPYSRTQWALMMVTLFVLWLPMGWYLIFVVGPSSNVNPNDVVRAGALNLAIGVPLFIFIGRRILKVGK